LVYKLKQSFFVWIGVNNVFGGLSVAMNTEYERTPSTSVVVDGTVDNFSSSIAQHLTVRSKLPFYVSCSVPTQEPELQVKLEKAIMERLFKS